MSDIPTPETDAAIIRGEMADLELGHRHRELKDFARSLERRLTAMTRERDSAVQSMKDSMRNFRSTDVKRIEAERERDKARAMVSVARECLTKFKERTKYIDADIALARLDDMGKEANE